MIIDDRHYDVVIVGSGAAGGTLAGELAGSGLAVLVLERGQAMPLADQNVADVELFRGKRYHPGEPWFGPDGDPFAPQMVYALGGNTKIWGGVLQRLREEDFTGPAFQEGAGPDWELRYADLAPWYERAEALYRVHGRGGVDPTEPPRSGDYPHPPRPGEPFFEDLRQGLERQGLHPYPLPLTWSTSREDPSGDAERFGLERASVEGGITVRPGARVTGLHVSPSGTEVRGVEAEIAGQRWLFTAHQVVLAAGAVNSAAILLRSVSDRHPRGLANGSDQVGRNLMKPQLTSILQLAAEPSSARYPRSLGISDYLRGDRNVRFPLGSIQSGGGVLQDPLFAESPPVLSLVTRLMPDFGLEQLASRSVCWWAMSAVRPDPQNRVTLRGDRLQINYLPNNREAHDRLVYRWIDTLQQLEADPLTRSVRPAPTHPRGEAPLAVMGYACGTCRMGSDPTSSVVDLEGRSHEVANLTIADAAILPGCPAVGAGLTVIANALRIAERLRGTLS
ncbi:MAG: GMC family oxidoreductase [Synechococcaceae cyanobacterium]|nr:GMC family oxidoreductase [Synechococcaceae cyanobacterium]